MYKTLIFIGLTLLYFKTNAQTHFAPVGAKWEYTISNGFALSDTYMLLECVKDTVVQGQNARKIRGHYIANIYAPEKKREEWDEETVAILTTRNDSLFVFNNEKFEFRYKLKYAVGDSIFDLRNSEGKFRVKTIDSMAINDGKKVKRTRFDAECRSISTHYFYHLEQIGLDITGVFKIAPPCLLDLDSYHLCSYSDKNISYGTFEACKKPFTVKNTDLLPENAVTLTPSVASDFISIKTDFNFKNIEIQNLNGQTLKKQVLTEGIAIDISSLPRGLYFLQLIDNQGHRSVKKFVKI